MEENTKTKFLKVAKGALIAGGGAGLTYFLVGVGGLDFGSYTPMVAALASILINAIKEITRTYDR